MARTRPFATTGAGPLAAFSHPLSIREGPSRRTYMWRAGLWAREPQRASDREHERKGRPHRQDSDRRQGRRKATSFGHCTSQATMSNDAPLHPLLFEALFFALFASVSLPICTPHALCPCQPFPSVKALSCLPHRGMSGCVRMCRTPMWLSVVSLSIRKALPPPTCVPNMSASCMPTVSSTCAISQESACVR